MNTRLVILTLILVAFGLKGHAQDEWEPQFNVTGYINTIAEFTDQKDYKRLNENIGIGLAEVGLLASYKPLERLELKSTIVYKHDVADIQSMLVEAYGIYTFNEHFKVGLGKFLTPLSPVNVYFYAPLNPSVVLPMVVSHHYLSPQSISGVQFAGSFGDDLKLNYNLTYGNYTTIGHIRSGIINLQGAENLAELDPAAANKPQNYALGGSARISGSWKEKVLLGLNYFDGTRASMSYVDVFDVEELYFDSRKWSAGVDFHLNFDDRLKFNAEYWIGSNTTTELKEAGAGEEVELEYEGYYAEIIYNMGKFTPYVRFEEVNDLKGLLYAGAPLKADPTEGAGTPLGPWGTMVGLGESPIKSIGFGAAYRPFYELLLKVDYRMLETSPNQVAESALNLSNDEFNHLIFSAVFSF
jgi:hypothetical protein